MQWSRSQKPTFARALQRFWYPGGMIEILLIVLLVLVILAVAGGLR